MLSIIDGAPWPEEPTDGIENLLPQPFDIPWTAEVNGRLVYFEPLVRASILFLIVVPLAAAALHATRSKSDSASGEVED